MEKPRPKVVVHMLTGVDGRLDTNRFSLPLGKNDPNDIGFCYYTICDNVWKPDATMLGRNTIKNYFMKNEFDYTKYPPAEKHETFIGKRDSRLQVIFDSKGRTVYESDKILKQNILAVLGESVSEEYLKSLREKGISYLFAGKDGRDYKLALEKMYEEFGMKTVVLEGGGIINGEFLKRGLIDEISILLTPQIDGLSGEPSIFNYVGKKGERPADGISLELIEYKPQDEGCMWMRYKVHKINKQ